MCEMTQRRISLEVSAATATPMELLQTRPPVSVSEAARILSVSRGQGYAMVRSGELRTIRIGSRLVVPTAQLRALIEGAA